MRLHPLGVREPAVDGLRGTRQRRTTHRPKHTDLSQLAAQDEGPGAPLVALTEGLLGRRQRDFGPFRAKLRLREVREGKRYHLARCDMSLRQRSGRPSSKTASSSAWSGPVRKPVEARIVSRVDDPHAAVAELGTDRVWPKGRARFESHGFPENQPSIPVPVAVVEPRFSGEQLLALR